MSGEKYIGLDVHQATISAAVMDSMGKVVMESILETRELVAMMRLLEEGASVGTDVAWISVTQPWVFELKREIAACDCCKSS